MNYEHLNIDNQLCFALYASSKAIIKSYKPLLDELGITYTQYISLLVLWQEDNITLKELGSKLYLDSGTLTPVLKRLETLGVIQRVRDSIDERNVYIKLTEEGHLMKDKAAQIPEKIFCDTNLSLDEASDLRDKLKFLLNNLQK